MSESKENNVKNIFIVDIKNMFISLDKTQKIIDNFKVEGGDTETMQNLKNKFIEDSNNFNYEIITAYIKLQIDISNDWYVKENSSRLQSELEEYVNKIIRDGIDS